jgi:hypothetical protein
MNLEDRRPTQVHPTDLSPVRLLSRLQVLEEALQTEHPYFLQQRQKNGREDASASDHKE